MNKKTKIFAIIFAAVLIGVGAFFIAQRFNPANSIKQEPIKIGFIGPLSGEAAFGQEFLNAIALSMEDLNASAGYEKYKLITEDSQCDSKKAVDAINKLAEIDQIKYIFGGVCSNETESINPLIDNYGIVSLSFALASSVAKESPNQYIILPPSELNIAAMLDYAKKNNKNNIALIYANTKYCLENEQYLEKEAIENNVKIVAAESYNFGNVTDYKTQLTKIKAQNPDIIFMLPQGFNEPIAIIQQAKELGFNQPIITEETGCAALSMAKEKFENVVCASALAGFDTRSEKFQTFKNKYKQKYGQEPIYGLYQALSYDAMMLFDKAIENKDVKKYLNENKYEGVGGLIKFNSERINIGLTKSNILVY